MVIQSLRARLSNIPGINLFLVNPPPITIGSNSTRSPYQITLQSSDLEELYRWAPILQQRLASLPGFIDVTSDLELRAPELSVALDRDRAQSLGVTPERAYEALYTVFGDRQISLIHAPSNEYRVITELDPKYTRDSNALSLIRVRSDSGRLVPLDTITRPYSKLGPTAIQHSEQSPSVTVTTRRSPRIPGVKLGKLLRYRPADVEVFMAELNTLPASRRS